MLFFAVLNLSKKKLKTLDIVYMMSSLERKATTLTQSQWQTKWIPVQMASMTEISAKCVYKGIHWKINGNSILMDANHNQWIEKSNDGGEQVVRPEAMRERGRGKDVLEWPWWPFKCLGGISVCDWIAITFDQLSMGRKWQQSHRWMLFSAVFNSSQHLLNVQMDTLQVSACVQRQSRYNGHIFTRRWVKRAVKWMVVLFIAASARPSLVYLSISYNYSCWCAWQMSKCS